MGMANLHPSCPSSLLLLLAGSAGHGGTFALLHARSPRTEPAKRGFLCYPHTAPTSEQSHLAEPGVSGALST